jgi:hypothetical protein
LDFFLLCSFLPHIFFSTFNGHPSISGLVLWLCKPVYWPEQVLFIKIGKLCLREENQALGESSGLRIGLSRFYSQVLVFVNLVTVALCL